MKYLCLIYSDEKSINMTETEANALTGEYLAFSQDVRNKGQLVAAEPLMPAQTATTLRVRNGKLSTTDGPFAETKEQLGGFYLVEAFDLNDAIQIAAKIPGARMGSIEVRQVRQLPSV